MSMYYLDECNDSIFDIIVCKKENKIELDSILINPLFNFIDNVEDSQSIINESKSYFELLKSFELKENIDSNLILNQKYFSFGISFSEYDDIHFRYSEEFMFNPNEFETIHLESIKLGKKLNSILNSNKSIIESHLEKDIEDIISYNNQPIGPGIAEVFGIVLMPNDNSFDLSTIHYSCQESLNAYNNIAISEMFNKVAPIICNYFKYNKFFIIKEPVTIIKLGISTSGDYAISFNTNLLFDLNEEDLESILFDLIRTYESI